MKPATIFRSAALAATLLGASAGAANAGNVSFGLGFYSPAPIYYETYAYPPPVYYAPSYRVIYRQPAYYSYYGAPYRNGHRDRDWHRHSRHGHGDHGHGGRH
jgi:hypothetical protein